MALRGIDHVAVAVHDLERAVPVYRRLLEVRPQFERLEKQGVVVALFPLQDGRVELLEPLGEDSPVASFLEQRGEGIHHLALRTDGVDAERDRLEKKGFPCLDASPRPGASGYRIAFLHPGGTHGALIELAQPPED